VEKQEQEGAKESVEDENPAPIERITDSTVAEEITLVKQKLSDRPSLSYVETPLKPEEKKKVT